VKDLLQSKAFDLVVLSSPRPGPHSSLGSLSGVLRPGSVPFVLIDGEDDASVRRDLFYRYKCGLYFKREYRSCWRAKSRFSQAVSWRTAFKGDQNLFARTHPLPMSVDLKALPSLRPAERNVDMSYVARASHPKRIKAVRLLTGSGLRFEGGLYADPTDRRSKFMTGLPKLWTKLVGDPVISPNERGTKLTPSSYYDLLMRSKMALSIRGGGFDTLRYWEIPATKTLLVSEQPDIEIPENFIHGQHALFVKPDLSNLIDLVGTYANDEKACTEMAMRDYTHLLEHHTCERRADYFLEVCRRQL
jgi:hypothetical protein